MSKRKKTNIQLPMSNIQSTATSNTEDNHDLDKFIFDKVDVGIWYIYSSILYYLQLLPNRRFKTRINIFCSR